MNLTYLLNKVGRSVFVRVTFGRTKTLIPPFIEEIQFYKLNNNTTIWIKKVLNRLAHWNFPSKVPGFGGMSVRSQSYTPKSVSSPRGFPKNHIKAYGYFLKEFSWKK